MTNKTKKEDNDDSLTKALAGESLIETVDKDRSPDEAVVETRAMDNDNDKDKDLVINESA